METAPSTPNLFESPFISTNGLQGSLSTISSLSTAHRRRSIVEPMRKLLKRLSGVSSSSTRQPKTPKLASLDYERDVKAFRTWKRQRPAVDSQPRTPQSCTSIPSILPTLLPNPITGNHNQVEPRGCHALRAAPLARPEESFLGDLGPTAPRVLTRAARRLSGPIRRIRKRKTVLEMSSLSNTTPKANLITPTRRLSTPGETGTESWNKGLKRTHTRRRSSPERRQKDSEFLPNLCHQETIYLPPTGIGGYMRKFSECDGFKDNRVADKLPLLKVTQMLQRSPSPQLSLVINTRHPHKNSEDHWKNGYSTGHMTSHLHSHKNLPPPPHQESGQPTVETQHLAPTHEQQLFNAKKWSLRLQDSMNRAGKKKALVAGTTLFNMSPKKGIAYLASEGIVKMEPVDIAKFLQGVGLNRKAIGEYFGRLSDPLATQAAQQFINALDFQGIEVDEALRKTFAHFHPEGESQKIEFILHALMCSYTKQNPHRVSATFSDQETIKVLSYSIMMLHTGFYNRNVRRLSKPMTFPDFINNNRGIDAGNDLSASLLRGIYERVTAEEFKTLPDISDRLREVDKVLVGSLKPGGLLERHRGFVAWVVANEVVNVTVRRSRISLSTSPQRAIFIFNDILVIAKPLSGLRISAVEGRLWMGGSSQPDFADDLHTTASSATNSRRRKSMDRIVGRITSPTGVASNSGQTGNPRVHNRSFDGRFQGVCSTEVPTNGIFHFRQCLSLDKMQVLVFESEYYKYGVQLRDDTRVLINLNLPNSENRIKFIDWLYASIEETKELMRLKATLGERLQTSIGNPDSASSA